MWGMSISLLPTSSLQFRPLNLALPDLRPTAAGNIFNTISPNVVFGQFALTCFSIFFISVMFHVNNLVESMQACEPCGFPIHVSSYPTVKKSCQAYVVVIGRLAFNHINIVHETTPKAQAFKTLRLLPC